MPGTSVGGPYRNEQRPSPRLQSRCSGSKRPIYGRSWSPILESQCGQHVEPLVELIRGTVGNSKLWIYLPGDKDGDWFGHMVQYLIVPTAAAVEDSEHFLQAEDVASIAATWRPFDYVWIRNSRPSKPV